MTAKGNQSYANELSAKDAELDNATLLAQNDDKCVAAPRLGGLDRRCVAAVSGAAAAPELDYSIGCGKIEQSEPRTHYKSLGDVTIRLKHL